LTCLEYTPIGNWPLLFFGCFLVDHTRAMLLTLKVKRMLKRQSGRFVLVWREIEAVDVSSWDMINRIPEDILLMDVDKINNMARRASGSLQPRWDLKSLTMHITLRAFSIEQGLSLIITYLKQKVVPKIKRIQEKRKEIWFKDVANDDLQGIGSFRNEMNHGILKSQSLQG
jgi:hypothetical protein